MREEVAHRKCCIGVNAVARSGKVDLLIARFLIVPGVAKAVVRMCVIRLHLLNHLNGVDSGWTMSGQRMDSEQTYISTQPSIL